MPEESEKLGLKETLEVVSAVQTLAVDVINASKDGLDVNDVAVLLKNVEPLKEAVVGADVAVKELKDLDWLEVQQLVSSCVGLGFAVVEALKAKKA